MGVNNTELWNNMGLCCFYASQYDMTLSCFERALSLADDDNMSDVWYNLGQVAVGIGDLNLAYQAFKISVSVDSNHAESFNNLGVLEIRKGNAGREEQLRGRQEPRRTRLRAVLQPGAVGVQNGRLSGELRARDEGAGGVPGARGQPGAEETAHAALHAVVEKKGGDS